MNFFFTIYCSCLLAVPDYLLHLLISLDIFFFLFIDILVYCKFLLFWSNCKIGRFHKPPLNQHSRVVKSVKNRFAQSSQLRWPGLNCIQKAIDFTREDINKWLIQKWKIIAGLLLLTATTALEVVVSGLTGWTVSFRYIREALTLAGHLVTCILALYCAKGITAAGCKERIMDSWCTETNKNSRNTILLFKLNTQRERHSNKINISTF